MNKAQINLFPYILNFRSYTGIVIDLERLRNFFSRFRWVASYYYEVKWTVEKGTIILYVMRNFVEGKKNIKILKINIIVIID